MISLTKKIDNIVARINNDTELENSNFKFPCGICKNNVKHNHKSIFCDQCNNWMHIECNNVSISEYKELQNEPDNKHLVCLYCSVLNNYVIFPFTLVPDSIFQETNVCDTSSDLSFEIVSRLTNLPNLSTLMKISI